MDIDLSGGPAIEHVDYLIGITGWVGSDSPSYAVGIQTLRVKNPCFDPSLVSIVTLPLPAGPHSYTLYDYQADDPYWIMTHEAWSYTTSPIEHQLCGDITYAPTYEGVPVDELSIPNMAYH